MKQAGRGFTLIELLMVIAIILILAAILFPVFANAKSAALKTQCTSQIRQLGISWHLYADDYDDQSVPSYYPSPLTGIEISWDFSDGNQPGLLFPYTKSALIAKCPSFMGESWSRLYTGYALNASYIGGDYWSGIEPANRSQISSPSETVLFADAGFGQPVRANNYLRSPSDSLFVAGKVHFRHNGFANLVWADGHASSWSKRFNTAEYESVVGSISEGDELYDLE